jgi:voltage-gated potassium channel
VENLKKSPNVHDQIHFVQPSDEEVLLNANILFAKRVAIFTDPSIDSALLADGKALLIASAVERLATEYNVNIYTIVEIRDELHIHKFEHISIDSYIFSNDSVSMLMAKAVLYPGTTKVFRQLLSKRYGSNIYEVKSKKNGRH